MNFRNNTTISEDHGCTEIWVSYYSFSLWCPDSLKKSPAVCPFSHFSCYLQETPQDTSLWLGLSPIDTGTPDGPLMLPNCFIDFAVEYWISCCATEPGFTGDVGGIEIWSIDWYSKSLFRSILLLFQVAVTKSKVLQDNLMHRFLKFLHSRSHIPTSLITHL